MRDNFSRCNRTEPWASAIEKTEHKTPFCGHPNGSEMRFASNGNSQRNAVRLLIASRGSDREGCPQKGVFHSQPSGRVSKWAEVGRTQNRSINVRAITQPLARDKQTCPARGMRNSSAMPDSWLDVTRCHNPRITRRQAQRTGPPIALTRQGV